MLVTSLEFASLTYPLPLVMLEFLLGRSLRRLTMRCKCSSNPCLKYLDFTQLGVQSLWEMTSSYVEAFSKAPSRGIGFEGHIFIQPKPREPTQHPYDWAGATSICCWTLRNIVNKASCVSSRFFSAMRFSRIKLAKTKLIIAAANHKT